MKSRCVVNGAFDLVHVGHVRLLDCAMGNLGWVLAAVDTDEFVRSNIWEPVVSLA